MHTQNYSHLPRITFAPIVSVASSSVIRVHEYSHISNALDRIASINFTLEHAAIRAAQDHASAREAQENALKEATRIRAERVESPVQKSQSPKHSVQAVGAPDPRASPAASGARGITQTQIDFRDFEQGLPPPDPWDTPSNDLQLLHQVMHKHSTTNTTTTTPPATNTLSIPQIPPRPSNTTPQPQHAVPQQQQQQQSSHTYTNLVQMGFPNDHIRSAMALYSDSQKSMLDYLVAIDTFTRTNKPASIQALEMAATVYGTTPESLPMWNPFVESFDAVRELGFEPARVRDALLAKDNNRIEAIEMLMGSS